MWLSNVANNLNLSNSPSANILFKLPDLIDPTPKIQQNANISGEQYIRTLAHYIHANERRLTTSTQASPPPSGHRRADSGSGSFSLSNLWSISTALTSTYLINKSTPPATQIPSPAGSNSSYQKSSNLVTLDHHHFYYLLTKFSEYGFDVGAFESKLDGMEDNVNNNSRSNSKDKLETASITSATSVNSMSSAMSSMSLFSGWHGWSKAAQSEEVPIEEDIRYIYRVFLKLSGLKLAVISHTKIEGSESWSSLDSMLSLTPFRNLTQLEICKLPIKIIDGWDLLQEKLEMLTIQNGSIDDITELFVNAVVTSMKRRKIKKNKKLVVSDEEETTDNSISKSDSTKKSQETNDDDQDPTSILPPRIWSRLVSINLSENSLTFIANEPVSFITTCTHLDLSHNLFIAVPEALAQLYNLQYLNLSHNMIESVLNIYKVLGNVTKLDLRNNRVENLCGLERVITLEWVDIRENRLFDWEEIGRMTEVSGIKEIYVEGNPFAHPQSNYRVNIFTEYKKNDLDILLDGYGPSMKERRQINVPTKQPEELQRVPTAALNRVMSIEHLQVSPKKGATPSIDIPVLKQKKRNKRIVDPHDDADELLPDKNSNNNGTEEILVKHNRPGAGKKKKDPAMISSSPPRSNEASDQKRPMHRGIKVEKAYAHDIDPKVRDLRKKKSSKNIRAKTLDTPPRSPALNPASAISDSEVATHTPSGSPPIGEDFRNRMEKLRNEGGAAWLKVFNEMEYGEGNKLREPRLKQALHHVLHGKKDTEKNQSKNVNS
ncbi:10788_t:CDS:2 [Ambispora gerdemannii]|uniref:10788_t:CDS:1 n=1 Tax=Ambispora gerdemannii TaxID=144530 RepID=A0A9N9B5Y4_9GLOM|nr:10788_t:CDS:2 [Ambispora gerdemannii]